jgi:hypothetical protein
MAAASAYTMAIAPSGDDSLTTLAIFLSLLV